jgi:RNA polymerase sigma-70 factor (ECF subfamily)
MASENAAATFDPLRPKLIRIAHRMMLGSVANAEDMVQEADADRDAVREPQAYLRGVVTRQADGVTGGLDAR